MYQERYIIIYIIHILYNTVYNVTWYIALTVLYLSTVLYCKSCFHSYYNIAILNPSRPCHYYIVWLHE